MNPSKSRGFNTEGLVQELTFTAGKGDTTTVTQQTSRSTDVTINSTIGQITTSTASLASGAEASFEVNNSYCTVKSVPIIAIAGGNVSQTIALVTSVADGGFSITLTNLDSIAETGAIVINFILIRGE